MGANRIQLMRMVKFIAEVRKKRYPNSRSFARLLAKTDWLDEKLTCTPRTILRDIELLKEDYQAPLVYDSAHNGYTLSDPAWQFQVPLLCEEHITHFLLSARLVGQFLPQPLAGKVEQSLDQVLAGNPSTFLDRDFLDSLLMASGQKAQVMPEVFEVVFRAWRLLRAVEIVYHKPNQESEVRRFEPHLIAFHHGLWYVKGHPVDSSEIRVLALHRISEAKFLPEHDFEPDRVLLRQTQIEGLFGFDRLSGIRLRCDKSIAFYLREQQKMKKFQMATQPNGDLIVILAPAIEHEVIRWILGEGGKIEVLEPHELRVKVAEAGKRIQRANEVEHEPCLCRQR